MAAGAPSLTVNIMDLLVLGGLGYGMFRGLSDGLEKPIQRASMVVAGLAAIRYYTWIDSYILNYFNVTPNLAPYISGLLIFVVVFVVLNSLFSGFHQHISKYSFLPSLGKAIGAIWGGLKAAVLISFISMGLGIVQLPPASLTADSYLYPRIKGFGVDLFSAIFSEIPILQKIIGDVTRVFGPKTNPTIPLPTNPNINLPSPTDATDNTVVRPQNPSTNTNSTSTRDMVSPSNNDRRIRDREVQIDRNNSVVNPTPNYPKYSPEVKEKVVPKKTRPAGPAKPPTVR